MFSQYVLVQGIIFFQKMSLVTIVTINSFLRDENETLHQTLTLWEIGNNSSEIFLITPVEKLTNVVSVCKSHANTILTGFLAI